MPVNPPKVLSRSRADRQLGPVDMNRLAASLHARFQQKGDMSDLDTALALTRKALECHPVGHPKRAMSLGGMTVCLHSRYLRTKVLSDLDEALFLQRTLLALYPRGHSGRPRALAFMGTFLFTRFNNLAFLTDLDEALAYTRDALKLCPKRDPDRIDMLENMGIYRHIRFKRCGARSDLDEAVSFGYSVLGFHPEGHPKRPKSLGNLAEYLHTRFKCTRVLFDLDEAISLQRSVPDLHPEGHPERAAALGRLAIYLHTRFVHHGVRADLEEVFSSDSEHDTSQRRPESLSYRTSLSTNVAELLHAHFTQLVETSDLDEALTLARAALALKPEGQSNRGPSMENLALFLYTRYTQLGVLSDLDEALSLQKNALLLHPETLKDSERAISWSNLAHFLHTRFKRHSMQSDLDEALVLERKALQLRPEGHPDRIISLAHIADCLCNRFEHLGRLADLDESLSLSRDALQLYSQEDPNRAVVLGNAAIYLQVRFRLLGMQSDNDEALSLARSTLQLRPEGHPGRALSLAHVASFLVDRFKISRDLSDLDEALSLQRSVLKLHPGEYSRRASALKDLAYSLHLRFWELDEPSDLEEAISLGRNALELLPEGVPSRRITSSNVANYLLIRFKMYGRESDIEEALSLQRDTLKLYPQGHPDRAVSLGNLARCLHFRFWQTRDVKDMEDMFNVYIQLRDIPQTASLEVLGQWVKEWIQSAETYKHDTTVLAYQTFLRLSVHYLTALPSLPQNLALLKQLMSSIPANAFSACIRYTNPSDAVESLEQSRGVFWNMIFRFRSPLDDVIASGAAGKELADKFSRLAILVHTALANAQPEPEKAFRFQIQLQDVTADIRRLPGLSRFLEPPLFSWLQAAAADGPVIIVNASGYGCDAIIILADQSPIHTTLPTTKAYVSELSLEFRSVLLRAKLGDISKDLKVLLRVLWDSAVSPIVKKLEKVCLRGSRVWWCPAAEFSVLPLHAAGAYRKGQPNFSNLYVSSYTPTLTALIRARQNQTTDPPPELPRFLIVGQAQAAGQCKLPSVNAELSTISQRIQSVAEITCVQDEDATVARVSEELSETSFVHLACHGIVKRKRPFESGFALGDGRLTIEHIKQFQLEHARLAYLSACHTTVGDRESPDEVLHLAAAMQFAGFRSVIGTMWAVDDGHATEISSKFYEYLVDGSGRLDHTRAARALHKTMRNVSREVPFDQRILYVHIGV